MWAVTPSDLCRLDRQISNALEICLGFGFELARSILATKPRSVFRTEPGHDFWMSLPRFCFCDFRKVEFDPSTKCPSEHFSKVWVIGGLDNRTAKIKRLFRR